MSEPAFPRFPDSPHARAILHRRAVRLACESEQAGRAARSELFLAIRLGARERYGLPYRWIDEIVRPRGLTPVPGTPPFIAGVMARRGRLLTILDLAQLLAIEHIPETEDTRLVMVRAAGYHVGLRVAEVIGNDHFQAELLGQAPGSGLDNQYISGIQGGQLAMLDLEALLNDSRIRIGEQP